ncbi:hypothetical protein RJT34_13790 [Clitoria ternatea]|uniref:Uncharacterized protein n=1 Tax=Clitoria ternatea TaxID=43366 RepID=A0AAN9JRS4_CLITE
MCSNTCNTACVCGPGGNVATSIWSSSLKKQQKRPRIPKRGPGVAELEKILREQETIDSNSRGNTEGLSSNCYMSHHQNTNSFHSSSLKSHLPPPPTSLGNIPSVPKFDQLGSITLPTITSVCGNCGPLARNGGSGLVSSEKELFPVNINSSKSKSGPNEGVDGCQVDSGNSPSRNLSNESNSIWSYPATATIQKRNNQYPPPMMNQFSSSSGSLSIGLYNHQEPPSNQSSYYNYTSKAREEHKLIGTKRSYSSSLENSLIPPSNFHVLPSFSHYNRSHQSSLDDTHGIGSFSSTKECFSRDGKWGSTLELNSTRLNSDILVPGHANFPPFAAPEVHSPPMHLFQGVLSKGSVLSSQVTEDKRDSRQHTESSSGSDRRPFINFLEVKDSEGMTERKPGTNHGGRDAERDAMDLSLKL